MSKPKFKWIDAPIDWEARSRAVEALYEYEKNCIAKYDRTNRPSLPPCKGEYMSDFADKYGTTIWDMKQERNFVEMILSGKVKHKDFEPIKGYESDVF